MLCHGKWNFEMSRPFRPTPCYVRHLVLVGFAFLPRRVVWPYVRCCCPPRGPRAATHGKPHAHALVLRAGGGRGRRAAREPSESLERERGRREPRNSKSN